MKTNLKHQTQKPNSRRKQASPRDALYSYITDLEALPLAHPNLPEALMREHQSMIQKAWTEFDQQRQQTGQDTRAAS